MATSSEDNPDTNRPDGAAGQESPPDQPVWLVELVADVRQVLTDRKDAARHSVHEHAEMDEILEELREMDMSSPGWLTRFKTLKHDYEHHMEEEEDEVFTRAKKVIGAEHNDAFGKKFLDHKATEEKLVEKKREDALHDD